MRERERENTPPEIVRTTFGGELTKIEPLNTVPLGRITL
jgi:hypothetical protein